MYYCIYFHAGVVGNVEFSCDAELCLSQQVEYQCTADSPLRWRIRDETMSELDTRPYLSGDTENVSGVIDGATDFSTVLISNTNPLISNISFTVQSSIGDYTIECETPSVDIKECVINIAGMITGILINNYFHFLSLFSYSLISSEPHVIFLYSYISCSILVTSWCFFSVCYKLHY